MRHLRRLVLATSIALVAACGGAGSASATTIDPSSVPFSLLGAGPTLAVSGGGVVSCGSSTIGGTTPATGSTTWAALPLTTMTFASCTWSLISASVTASVGCARLHLMAVSDPSAAGLITLPAGCSIDISVPAIGCTLVVTGGQTIGNGSASFGGIQWANLGTSQLRLQATTVPRVDSNGVGFGCPTAGTHTGTMSGVYDALTTNVIVTT
jgi:hypothetical protein